MKTCEILRELPNVTQRWEVGKGCQETGWRQGCHIPSMGKKRRLCDYTKRMAVCAQNQQLWFWEVRTNLWGSVREAKSQSWEESLLNENFRYHALMWKWTRKKETWNKPKKKNLVFTLGNSGVMSGCVFCFLFSFLYPSLCVCVYVCVCVWKYLF